jgi:hypothetical protein
MVAIAQLSRPNVASGPNDVADLHLINSKNTLSQGEAGIALKNLHP